MAEQTGVGVFLMRVAPSKRDRVPEALQAHEIIIGWSKARGLLKPDLTREGFKRLIRNAYPQRYPTDREAGRGTGEMWRFIREMKVGDLAVVPHGSEFYVARVLGPARYDAGRVSDDMAYRRPVEWIAGPIPRGDAPPHLQKELKSRFICRRIPNGIEDLVGLVDLHPTPSAADLPEPDLPERAEVVVYRILRDTRLARELKRIHRSECQICGYVLALPNGNFYSEAHHIQPLGAPHNGPDIEENILVLCPNHHAACDLGAIQLDHKSLDSHPRHRVGKRYVDYHNKKISAVVGVVEACD